MQYEWTVDINVTCNDKGPQTPSKPQGDLNVKNKLDVSGSRPGFTFSLFSVSLPCISNLSFKIRNVQVAFLCFRQALVTNERSGDEDFE